MCKNAGNSYQVSIIAWPRYNETFYNEVTGITNYMKNVIETAFISFASRGKGKCIDVCTQVAQQRDLFIFVTALADIWGQYTPSTSACHSVA